jgi:hypothetical protein
MSVVLSKIKSWLFTSNHKHLNNRLDMTESYAADEISRLMTEANQAKFQLADFMGCDGVGTKIVSLGENCSSAWYIKQLGLKEASFPFDWIFSSPEIVLDCTNDRFEKYLDKSLIVPNRNNTSAGHSYYHKNLFNHRNPLASEDDYSYHKRCCDRFISLLESQDNACFLITLINEPSKRQGWAKGFTNHFLMPKSQTLDSVSELIESIKEKNVNSKFVIVDHYTDSKGFTISEKISEHVFLIKFHANGESTGVFFSNQLDDFRFKLILTGLYGIPKTTDRVTKELDPHKTVDASPHSAFTWGS